MLVSLDPQSVKIVIGVFLLAYSAFQLRGISAAIRTAYQDTFLDRCVGFVGGVFGGFAGLSGPFPLIWLQLRGLPPTEQRARYQPFNLLILSFAAMTMAFVGKLDAVLLPFAAVAVPFSLLGAASGVRVFMSVSESLFQRVFLAILFCSGAIIVTQTVMS